MKKESSRKDTTEFLTNMKRAAEVLATSKKPEAMVNSDLKALVKWKKRKGDEAIPSTKPLLLVRYAETIDRSDLTLAQFLEENGMQHSEGWV